MLIEKASSHCSQAACQADVQANGNKQRLFGAQMGNYKSALNMKSVLFDASASSSSFARGALKCSTSLVQSSLCESFCNYLSTIRIRCTKMTERASIETRPGQARPEME